MENSALVRRPSPGRRRRQIAEREGRRGQRASSALAANYAWTGGPQSPSAARVPCEDIKNWQRNVPGTTDRAPGGESWPPYQMGEQRQRGLVPPGSGAGGRVPHTVSIPFATEVVHRPAGGHRSCATSAWSPRRARSSTTGQSAPTPTRRAARRRSPRSDRPDRARPSLWSRWIPAPRPTCRPRPPSLP